MDRVELLRLTPADGSGSATLPGIGECSYLVMNPLSAPVLITLGSGGGGGSPDLTVPGQALLTYPVGSETALSAAIAYPGAVPAGDAGLAVIVSVVTANLGATVGPLA